MKSEKINVTLVYGVLRGVKIKGGVKLSILYGSRWLGPLGQQNLDMIVIMSLLMGICVVI